jgi:four helix bundle protein
MFRFERLEIWKAACSVGSQLCSVADELEASKKFPFADQLRRAALSIGNNIAEGSGCESNKEFQKFLMYARRSVFENASMLLFFASEGYIENPRARVLLGSLEKLSRQIHSFSQSLS